MIKDVFGISHFAGDVYYQVDNFIKKNRNSINNEIYEVLSQSKNLVLSEIFLELK